MTSCKAMRGFEICAHTCVENGCKSMATNTVLWRKEGGACVKHVGPQQRTGRGTIVPTPDMLATFVPRIRQGGLMTDSTLAYELSISVEEVVAMFGGVSSAPDGMDIDPQPSSSTTELLETSMDDDPMGEAILTEHQISQNPPVTSTTPSSRATSQFSELSDSLAGSVRPRKGKQFKILYVPDPSRKCATGTEAQSDLSFALRTINLEVFDFLRLRLPGYIFSRSGFDDMTVMGSHKTLYNAEWLHVQDDLHAMGAVQGWVIFEQECLLGGIDYTIDYRYPVIDIQRSSDVYGWKIPSDVDLFAENLRMMQSLIVWPPPKQLEHAGWKLTVISNLTFISKSSVPSYSPSTMRLNPGDLVPENAVLKRSHSDSSTHVIMPSETRKREWSYLMAQAPGGEFWMAQDYMPYLATFGEWRVFIIGGTIIQVVHTHRGCNGHWHGVQVSSYWSLEELTYVFFIGPVFTILMSIHSKKLLIPGITTEEIVNPDQGTDSERRHAKKEFEAFTMNIWRNLVLTEKAMIGGSTSISIFCRLDVGLTMKDSYAMYFVNEVERSLTTSLWMSAMPDGLHGIFADTFAATLHDWLTGMIDPMHL
ncbi:hypothetical protein PAXRUDRAFT_28688 [Paxillus rubicundulus Ve08.2h10]|uniref:Uncharacterized protein n=1 Tax=Paxillus rubicundulus Ve08.2h10 TaxID=930991 RepID=A0A0D0D3H2_9AGAM|nr:hypothetical protein PAXRUDRAFT_28688 [Paxillus rubicundulus Ve08.2h10]